MVLNFVFDQTKYTQRLENISETSFVFTCLFLPAMVYEWYKNPAAWMTIRYKDISDISERNWLPFAHLDSRSSGPKRMIENMNLYREHDPRQELIVG